MMTNMQPTTFFWGLCISKLCQMHTLVERIAYPQISANRLALFHLKICSNIEELKEKLLTFQARKNLCDLEEHFAVSQLLLSTWSDVA